MDRPLDSMSASSQLTPPDTKTADALFRSYGGRLFGYFRFMLGSESGAKLVLADTLNAAAPEAGRARDLEQYGPRLFMLAHAECHKHQCAEAVGAGQHWTVVTGSGNPVLPEIARRAVARLAPDVREAYILSALYNNLSLPQMAEILGVGLDAAADLRAQAGLDFVRAVALCAQEAGFIQFAGSELRMRAEESLERDAAEPAPPLPMLSGPAAPPPPQAQQPPRTPLPPPSSLPSALPSSVALPPPSALPSPLSQTLPPPPDATTVEPSYLPAGNPTRFDQPVPEGFHRGAPDYGRAAGFGDDRGYDTGTHGGERLTGPLRSLTGPLFLGDYTPQGRRRRRALAWAGGGIAVAAVAVIGWQVLASGPDNTMTLTHGGVPSTSVPGGTGPGGPTGTMPTVPGQSPAASQSPTAAPSATETSGTAPAAGSQAPGGAAPAAGVPQPATGSEPVSAPATHAPTPAPSQTQTQPAPAPTTADPTTSAPVPPPSTDSASPAASS